MEPLTFVTQRRRANNEIPSFPGRKRRISQLVLINGSKGLVHFCVCVGGGGVLFKMGDKIEQKRTVNYNDFFSLYFLHFCSQDLLCCYFLVRLQDLSSHILSLSFASLSLLLLSSLCSTIFSFPVWISPWLKWPSSPQLPSDVQHFEIHPFL